MTRRPAPALSLGISLTLLILTALGGSGAVAAPKAEPWPRWEAHDEASTLRPDHGPWSALLERYVRPSGTGYNLFAYGAVTEADRRRLDAYLDRLAAVPVSALTRVRQKAFWINLYNALTVAVVLDHYPVDSIRDIDISPGLFAQGPWGAKLIEVEGEALSLDDMEHRILRPLFRDPRLHYALNCASLGCPNLAALAYTAERMETMLERAARAFVNHPRAVRLEGGALRLSSIYVWFGEDFGGDEAGVVAHLGRYADSRLAAALAGRTRIGGHAYDWRLNDAGDTVGEKENAARGLPMEQGLPRKGDSGE